MAVNNSSFKISESSSCGRFVTATKDFAMGEIILEEIPLLVAPIGFKTIKCHEAAGGLFVSVKTCVGCSRMLTTISNSCVQCGFPLCHPKCSKEPFHKRYECILFKNLNIAPKQSALVQLHVIRACLMYKDNDNPLNWQQFSLLSSKLDEETDAFKQSFHKEVRNAVMLINGVCKLGVDTTTIEKILRTFHANQFLIKGKDENGSSYEAVALYKTGCLFNHSCSANGDWMILPVNYNGIERFYLRIYARRNIYCNDAISIPYRQDFLVSDIASRRKYMVENHNFICGCHRCIEPTEFGFYTSSLRCSSCGNTNLLPDDSKNEYSTWTCSTCGDCTDYSVANGYVEDYEKSLCSLMKNKSPEEYESILDICIKSSHKSNLTENHRAISLTTFYWLRVQKFKDLLDHTMESQLKFIQILERAAKCLKTFRMFVPVQGTVFLELLFAYAIATYYFKTQTLCSIEFDNYSPDDKRQIVSAIYTHMKTGVDIMNWNPYDEFYTTFREAALLRFKFWTSVYESLNGVETVDMEGVDEVISSKGFQVNGAMNVLDQIKVSIGKFWAWVYQLTGMATGDSNLITPDVSLLSQYDFYFSN